MLIVLYCIRKLFPCLVKTALYGKALHEGVTAAYGSLLAIEHAGANV